MEGFSSGRFFYLPCSLLQEGLLEEVSQRGTIKLEENHPRKEDLDQFVREVRPAIERYVFKRVRNRDHGEEITSRVFESLARNWSTFRGDCPTQAFVVSIAANALNNYYSRDLQKLSRQISLDDWVETYSLQHSSDQSCPHQRFESKDWIATLLVEMKVCCSQVECGILGLVYQGETFQEISTLLGIDATTVRSHFLRARKKLLVHLLKENPDLLGGVEEILEAVDRIEINSPGLLTKDEAAAVRTRGGGAEILRSAMLKVAPFLRGLS